MGTNAQVMAVYSSALELMEPLLGSAASVDDIATAVVQATYDKVNSSWADNGDGSVALSTADTLCALYSQAYTAALPASRRRTAMRRLAASLRTADELKPLCNAVSRVRARRPQCGRGHGAGCTSGPWPFSNTSCGFSTFFC
jgi:hypothetical protein